MKNISIKTIARFVLSLLFATAMGVFWNYIQETPFRSICQEAAQEKANNGNYEASKQVYDECLKAFQNSQ